MVSSAFVRVVVHKCQFHSWQGGSCAPVNDANVDHRSGLCHKKRRSDKLNAQKY